MPPHAMKINLLVKPEILQEVVGLSGTGTTLIADIRFVLIYYDLSRRHLTQIHECRRKIPRLSRHCVVKLISHIPSLPPRQCGPQLGRRVMDGFLHVF